MDYYIILYIILGLLPSLVWLFYYLRKDIHPEPKRMVLRIFLWGALITLPVFFVQMGLAKLLEIIGNSVIVSPLVNNLIYWFVVIAFTEELFKYLVVKIKVVTSPHLDEPLDVMLYMVIAALGFAALENILYLFAPTDQVSFNEIISRTLTINFIRFIGAVFLHTLCSAVIGYSMAISFCEAKRKKLILVGGILIATALHGLYNFSIITLDGYIRFAIPAVVIITLAFLVFAGFENLKKMKGVCKSR